jgi:hypothetical protein
VLYSEFLLPRIIVELIVETPLLPICPIENQHFGKAKPRNILARAFLIQPKLVYLFEYCILPAIDFFMNKYPHVNAHYSPVIYIYVECLVTQCIQPGQNL